MTSLSKPKREWKPTPENIEDEIWKASGGKRFINSTYDRIEIDFGPLARGGHFKGTPVDDVALLLCIIPRQKAKTETQRRQGWSWRIFEFLFGKPKEIPQIPPPAVFFSQYHPMLNHSVLLIEVTAAARYLSQRTQQEIDQVINGLKYWCRVKNSKKPIEPKVATSSIKKKKQTPSDYGLSRVRGSELEL